MSIGPYIIGKDIDEIVCINLEHRIDRREYMLKEFKDYPFSFYNAQPHDNPVRGCLESHINVIKYAKAKGYKNIMILEDDVKIMMDLKTVAPFPDDWTMIYLGGLCTHIIDWSNVIPGSGPQNWIRGHIYCDHAYIINSSVFDKIIEDGWKFKGAIDDFYTSVIHSQYKCYIKEQYIIQKDDWSDIDIKHKWTDYKWPRVGDNFEIP